VYIIYEDVIARYPSVATWGKTETEVNSDLIYYAEMELNSRLSAYYSVPFSASHPTVKDLAIELTYYKALVTKKPKEAEEVRKAILGRLDDLKEGREFIFTGSNTTIAPSGQEDEIWSTTQDYHPTHGMLDPANEYTGIDSDWLDDEESERS